MAIDLGGKRGGTIAAINVTPMADVMIVLLIIFMVATPIVITDKVKLPPADHAKEAGENEKALVLELDAGGRLAIDGRDAGPFAPALGQVADVTASDPERPVRLKADRSVPYRWISRVMSACKGAPGQGVDLATGKPEVR
jgi:biopolymer transport protein TolR